MKKLKFLLNISFLVLLLGLAACSEGNEGEQKESSDNNENQSEEQASDENTKESSESHEGMEHSGSGEVPEGLKAAENPEFEEGSTAIIQEAHMSGMEGAQATIVGAYDTVAYSVSYDPKNGGERVENHKWVIHEEIEKAGEEALEPEEKVALKASHMEGMAGAEAVIDSAEETTVYMIDFTPTDGGEEVTNHKWVTANELSSE
ncbi:YdhK family protein [Halobacillus massiliensis]|uniref:YdhK family protein n=1 Tax=Halobacillus massiliensis TaxID=1926286 RepID=UPI0009E5C60E|nr:YdhK family protein [Halobacillus massiliensis]